MSTVAEFEAVGILSFHQALLQAEAQARSTLDAALHERLSSAVALVKDGAVFQANDHTWTVASASTPGKEYSPNGTCSCDDVHYNKPRYCKHQMAMFLSQRVLTLMRQPAAPVVPELVEPWPDNDPELAPPSPPVEIEPVLPTSTPMPSASPAADSAAPRKRVGMRLETSVVIDGRPVKVAVWGPDDAEVQARLQAVQAQYPALEAPPQGQPSQGQGKDWCGKHSVTMRWNEGKAGKRGWYSHRTDDGWCKGR